jgi:hypothetical protein
MDGIQTNVTQFFPVLKPTELRTDPNYSIYFNWFRFVAIGVIPFGLLVLFNAKIYSDIKVFFFATSSAPKKSPIPSQRTKDCGAYNEHDFFLHFYIFFTFVL